MQTIFGRSDICRCAGYLLKSIDPTPWIMSLDHTHRTAPTGQHDLSHADHIGQGSVLPSWPGIPIDLSDARNTGTTRHIVATRHTVTTRHIVATRHDEAGDINVTQKNSITALPFWGQITWNYYSQFGTNFRRRLSRKHGHIHATNMVALESSREISFESSRDNPLEDFPRYFLGKLSRYFLEKLSSRPFHRRVARRFCFFLLPVVEKNQLRNSPERVGGLSSH